MQAFFLDSGKKSSGTGVFLPLTQSPGPNNNYFHSTTRPGIIYIHIYGKITMEVSVLGVILHLTYLLL